MTSRAEVTMRYARAFKGGGQADQGSDPGRGGVRDRLVAGQRPAPVDQRGAAPAGVWTSRSRRGHASSGRPSSPMTL